jgi:DNA repair exonuclease SbcCD ATPase subunit
MEDAPKQNFGMKSTTTVTISMPNADETTAADSTISEEIHQPPIVSESTVKHQLVKERDSNALQIKHLKAAAENFKLLLGEKEKTITELTVGIQLLKQSFRPLDDKIQTTRTSVREKRAGELDLLRQKVKDADEWEKKFNQSISDYKANIDRQNARLLAQRKKMTKDCDDLERLYESEVENTKASLKELNKVHKQALAEHAKLNEARKFQLEKMDLMKQEMLQMRDHLEKLIAERSNLGKQTRELDARVLELEELAKMERESPALLKIEDNKRNLAMRCKQVSDATTLRNQKKQTLTVQKTKLTNVLQERDLLVEERKAMEKLFADQMKKQEAISAEIISAQAQLDESKKRLEQFESEMNEKINDIRRKSESYSNELRREMEGVRRESVHFAHKVQEKQRAEQERLEQNKEELRQELQSLDQMMEVLKQGHQLEMDSKLRHYKRKELDLEVFGKGEKEGNEFEINHVKGKIEKLGVQRNTLQAEFEEQQAASKEEIEWLRRRLAVVKSAADASKAISENKQREEVTRDLVRNMEREINAKKEQYFQMHKDAYDLKNDLAIEFDPEATMNLDSPLVQSPDGQVKF